MSGDFQIGEWSVQPAVNRLRRGDEVVRLEPKMMQVLVCLAEQAGEVVTREDLIARVWPDVFVTDDVLHRAIRELRRAFGDSSTESRYIETIRKRGYRLIVVPEPPGLPSTSVRPGLKPWLSVLDQDETRTEGQGFSPGRSSTGTQRQGVSGLSSGEGGSAPRTEGHAARTEGQGFSLGRFNRSAFVIPVALSIACVAALLVLLWRPANVASQASARFVPLVSGPLNESDPALSPDGRRVAFVQREAGDETPADIYIRDLSDGAIARVTDSAASDRMPAWSPDGRRLAFVRAAAGTCDLIVRVLATGSESRLALCGNREEPRVAWTADGRALLTSLAAPATALGWRLARVDVETGATTPVTEPPPDIVGDHSPAISPDGRMVAFIRRASGGAADVYVAPAGGGTARRVTFDATDLTGVDWTSDGRAVIYSSDRAGGYSLWRVPVDGGEPALVAGGAARMKHPVTDRSGRRIVYENWMYEINVWRTNVRRAGASAAPIAPEGLIDEEFVATPIVRTSELWNLYPQISPDGSRIAYVSTQSGGHELWTANADGTNARQLTGLDRGLVKMPRWSPDGRRIVFLARGQGAVDVHVIDVETRRVTALTATPENEIAPSWTHDGTRVLFGAPGSGGDWSVFQIEVRRARAFLSADAAAKAEALAEPAEPRQLVVSDAVAAQESPDGEWLYFTRPGQRGLWRAPASRTSDAELLVADVAAGSSLGWLVNATGLYYLAEGDGAIRLRRAPLAGGAAADVARLAQLSWPGFSISPDGAHAFYARWDRRESNIMSIEY